MKITASLGTLLAGFSLAVSALAADPYPAKPIRFYDDWIAIFGKIAGDAGIKPQ